MFCARRFVFALPLAVAAASISEVLTVQPTTTEAYDFDVLSLLQTQIRVLDRGASSLENLELQPKDANMTAPTGPSLRGRGPRVIFVAGVEGSGHHLLTLLWQELQWWGESLPWLKVQELRLPSTWDCESEWSREDVTAMTEKFQTVNQSTDTVWVLPIGYMSYPCGNGTKEERRDKFYPHVDWIAEAARAGGVDLSVLFVHRPIEDVLASNCLHRHFGNCDDSTEVIAANGLRLAEQIRKLQSIDSESVQCLEFGDKHLVSKDVLHALGFTREQLHLNRAIHKLWEPCSNDKTKCGTRNGQATCCGEDNRESVPGWTDLVEQLKPAEDALMSACKQAAQFHS